MSLTDDKLDELIHEVRTLSQLVRNVVANHELDHHALLELQQNLALHLASHSTTPAPPPPESEAA